MFGREQPGVENREVWRNDGEEEEEDAYDLGNVKGVVSFEKVGQDDEAENGCADDHTSYGFGPGFISIRKIREIRKHLGIAEANWTQSAQNRVARCLQAEGWERHRDRKQNMEWRYRRQK